MGIIKLGYSIVSPVLQPGQLYMQPLQRWLKPWVYTPLMASRTPTYQGESDLCNSLSPLEEPSLDGEGHGHGNGMQQEACHNRCFQHRLGGGGRCTKANRLPAIGQEWKKAST